jgi:hypothetical protein
LKTAALAIAEIIITHSRAMIATQHELEREEEIDPQRRDEAAI